MAASLRNPRQHSETAASAEAAPELRRLMQDLRDAAHDGHILADPYAELLKKGVGGYRNAFELRAQAAPARLEAAR